MKQHSWVDFFPSRLLLCAAVNQTRMNAVKLAPSNQSSRLTQCALLSALFLLATGIASQAQTNAVYTDPVGFYQITCLSNSDTRVSIPFTRPPVFFGLVQSIANNVIAVSGTPSWTPGQFAYASGVQSNTYYVSFANGQKEGFFLTITNNTANTLNLLLDIVPDLTGVAAGDRITIIPYWTLGTAFPGGSGITPTTSILSRKTELLLFDPAAVGINPSASFIDYFFQGHWRQVGQPTSILHDDDILLPDTHFIVRQSSGAPTTVFTPPGIVPTRKLTAPLYTHSSVKQDNVLGLARPANVSLNQSGLIESGGFVPTTSILSRKDELLFFDNTVFGKNKAASFIYYYFNGAWRKVGQSASIDVGADQVFLAGTGVVIRKSTNSTSATAFWVNSSNY